jgi:hypothetical protein
MSNKRDGKTDDLKGSIVEKRIVAEAEFNELFLNSENSDKLSRKVETGVAEVIATEDFVTDAIAAIPAPTLEYTYIEVPISSAEILDLGTTPKLLLATLGAGLYYDVDKISFEFTEGSTSYTLTDPYLNLIGLPTAQIQSGLITGGVDNIAIVRGGTSNYCDTTETASYMGLDSMGAEIKIGTWNNSNPTLGDGTILVKIWYKVHTLGTAL